MYVCIIWGIVADIKMGVDSYTERGGDLIKCCRILFFFTLSPMGHSTGSGVRGQYQGHLRLLVPLSSADSLGSAVSPPFTHKTVQLIESFTGTKEHINYLKHMDLDHTTS